MSTRADIRGLARIRADQDSSTFPTDAQYNTLINFAGKAVWKDLVKAGWPVNFATVTKTATGTNPITLGVAGTVFAIRGVYRVDGTTYTPLKRLNEGDRGSLLSSQGGITSHYSVMVDPTNGPVLELFPLPTSGSFRVEYLLEWAGFSADGDSWMGPAGSDELVALRAAAQGLKKEGDKQGAADLMGEYVVLLGTVQDMAGWFDMRNPPVITDVSGGLGNERMPFDYDV